MSPVDVRHEAWPAGMEAEGMAASLMTPLGWAEGEVLTYLERHGATPVRRIIRELEWPAPMIMMAVGALVREGLVQATRHDLEVIVEPNRAWTPRVDAAVEPVPEVWGG
jgi:hypothetical protein